MNKNTALVILFILSMVLSGWIGWLLKPCPAKTTPQIESEINKAEILRDDSMAKNTRTIRDSLAKELEKLHELE